MVTADHGPAVSGAHNTIVASRAGKDLVSSLASGLLTIGPRFGGALDAAAEIFTQACDAGTSPDDFVKNMRNANSLIMGIGHRIESLQNPDKRVEIVKNYTLEHFKDNTVLKVRLEESVVFVDVLRLDSFNHFIDAIVCPCCGAVDDQEEGQFDSQCRRLYRCLPCRHAAKLQCLYGRRSGRVDCERVLEWLVCFGPFHLVLLGTIWIRSDSSNLCIVVHGMASVT